MAATAKATVVTAMSGATRVRAATAVAVPTKMAAVMVVTAAMVMVVAAAMVVPAAVVAAGAVAAVVSSIAAAAVAVAAVATIAGTRVAAAVPRRGQQVRDATFVGLGGHAPGTEQLYCAARYPHNLRRPQGQKLGNNQADSRAEGSDVVCSAIT